MAANIPPSNLAPRFPPPFQMDKDDMSVDTAAAGKTPEFALLAFLEKTIRFRFETTTSHSDQQKPMIVHTHWMKTISDSYGEDVKILNNKNARVLHIDLVQWGDPLTHAQQIKVHRNTIGSPDARKTLHFIVHKIITKIPLGQVKNNSTSLNILKAHQTTVQEHHWKTSQWDLIHGT